MTRLAYLDASALVKLFAPEPESEAMSATLHADWPAQIASEILPIEVLRAALKHGGEAPARARELLRPIALLPLTPRIRTAASQMSPPVLRTLDAIHLATALSVDEKIGAIFTYDKRLTKASADAGLQVLAPA